MVSTQTHAIDPAPASWALGDDVPQLREAAAKFSRERLEPLLTHRADDAEWTTTVRLAATLDLGSMILPEQAGGMAISRHDLALVLEQFAAGPLERAAELALSSAALMTLRACNALDLLPTPDVRHYFDGTMSIAPGIPDFDEGGFWLLRQHLNSPAMTVQLEGNLLRLVLAAPEASQTAADSVTVTRLGALSLERHRKAAGVTPFLVVPAQRSAESGWSSSPVEQWLVEMTLYLSALLSGALQQDVDFALAYAASRQAFRKPLSAHQLVAARLADMLVAAHGVHLFVRAVAAQERPAQVATVCQMARHVASEAMDASRELVQLCGGHGYVEGLPPATRFQTVHWFAMLLMKVEAALRAFATTAQR
ncbi:acyl-CoA/acyl-ACP dehydrogenase [Paraburkholderia sp. A2WS-5]|uniref:acyl-CoA dehydrogenase family protein n=1 Tax=Paraburkholderia sp. A2WS-5 TaxID=3028372 RepID=UPI003B7C5301